MKKIIILIFVVCLIFTACSARGNDNMPVEVIPPEDIQQAVPLPLPIDPAAEIPAETPDETISTPPSGYQGYVGIWRGYAVAVTETLVITDVRENEITFLFVNVMSAAGFPDSASPVYTLPVIDNQISYAYERTGYDGEMFKINRTLTFHDNAIILKSYVNEDEDGPEWGLTRLS